MATLLQGVNRVLNRVGVLKTRNALNSLTDSANQMFIDTAIDNWNEVVDELYDLTPRVRPKAIKSSTITLATGVREYGLHSGLQAFRGDYHLIDETNNQIIAFMEDGHQSLVFGDIEQDDTGLPHFASINPENGRLLMDRAPTAENNGDVYKYRYEKDLELTDKDDEFPFHEKVFRYLISPVAEKWKFEHHKSGSSEVYDKGLALAAGALRKFPAREYWTPRRTGHNMMDPFDATAVR